MDELQLTIQETPGMTTPLPMRVFKMNDCDWYMARSLEEAKRCYQHDTGIDEFEDARELTDEELDRLKVTLDYDLPKREQRTLTYRRYLAELSASVIGDKPQFFASTEV